MKRGHIVSFASVFTPVAIGLTIALAAPGSASASTRDAAATVPAASAAVPRLVLLGCNNKPEVTPASIINCAAKDVGLTALHWTSWTPQLASGYGTYVLKDAKGHLQSYPALVALWGSAAVRGSHKYARMTLIFSGKLPSLSQKVNGKTVMVSPATLTFPTSP